MAIVRIGHNLKRVLLPVHISNDGSSCIHRESKVLRLHHFMASGVFGWNMILDQMTDIYFKQRTNFYESANYQ